MAALDGRIEIGIDYRPCMIHIPEFSYESWNREKQKMEIIVLRKEELHKALFHCWNLVTGNALVEYEDGTMCEVGPQNIRFVDGKINEYGFWEESSGQD